MVTIDGEKYLRYDGDPETTNWILRGKKICVWGRRGSIIKFKGVDEHVFIVDKVSSHNMSLIGSATSSMLSVWHLLSARNSILIDALDVTGWIEVT